MTEDELKGLVLEVMVNLGTKVPREKEDKVRARDLKPERGTLKRDGKRKPKRKPLRGESFPKNLFRTSYEDVLQAEARWESMPEFNGRRWNGVDNRGHYGGHRYV